MEAVLLRLRLLHKQGVDFIMSELDRYEILNNGMTVCMHECGGKNVRAVLAFSGGFSDEAKSNQGITHMLEHMMLRHLAKMPQREIYNRVRKMGTALHAATCRETVYFDIDANAKYIEEQLELLRMIFEEPQWTEEDFSKEKEVVLRQIEGKYYSETEQYIYEKCYSNRLKGLIMGTYEQIAAMQLSDVQIWHKKIMCPENACLTLAGAVDENISVLAKEKFSSLLGTKKETLRHETLPKNFMQRGNGKIYLVNSEYKTAEVALLFDVLPQDAFLMELLSTILGKGDGSELSLVLREEMGLTQEVLTVMHMFRDYSLFEINMQISEDCILRGISEIFTTLEQIKRNFSEERFLLHRDYLANWIELYCDGNMSEESDILAWRKFILGQDLKNAAQLANIYRTMAIQQIKNFSQKLLQKNNMTLIVSAPKGAVSIKELKKVIDILS